MIDSDKVSIISTLVGQSGGSGPSYFVALNVDIARPVGNTRVRYTVTNSKGKKVIKHVEKEAPFSLITNKEFNIPSWTVKFCEVYTFNVYAEIPATLKGGTTTATSTLVTQICSYT